MLLTAPTKCPTPHSAPTHRPRRPWLPALLLFASLAAPDPADATNRVVFLESNGTYDQVFSVPLDGSSAPVLLSSQAPAGSARLLDGGDSISPDNLSVVFVESNGGTDCFACSEQLFSRPIVGSGQPRLLSKPNPTFAVILIAAISPDSRSVVFLEQDEGSSQVFSRQIDGSGQVALVSSPAIPGTASMPVIGAISPDSATVVFMEIPGTYYQLYSRPLDASAAATRLSTATGNAGALFNPISPDGQTVVFAEMISGYDRVFSVPIDGSSLPTRLSSTNACCSATPDAGPISPDSQFAVFRENTGTYNQLFSRPLDGGGQPVLLSSAAPAGNALASEGSISPDSMTVVYHEVDDFLNSRKTQVFSRDIGGGGQSVLLSGSNYDGSALEETITPDGTTVVFKEYVGEYPQLFSRPIGGGGQPTRVSNVTPGSQLTLGAITPDSATVVFSEEFGGAEKVFSGPVAGGASPVALSRGAAKDRADLSEKPITPDGLTVVFTEIADTGDYEQLYSRAIDGSGSPILLSSASPVGDASFPIAVPEPSALLLALASLASLAGLRRGRGHPRRGFEGNPRPGYEARGLGGGNASVKAA